MNNNKTIVSVVIAVIVAGGLGFFLGTMHGAAATPARGAFAQGAGGQFRTGGRTGGGSANAIGQIISVSGNTVTIGLMTPGQATSTTSGSKIVLISNSTQILKTTSGSSTDLAAGTPVVVSGTTNADGSMTATSIQIRSSAMMGQPRPQVGQ